MQSASADRLITATVVPDVSGLDKQFDYLVPAALADRVAVGSMVRVPLHGRRVAGWVVRVGDADPQVAVERLLPISRWSGVGPSAEVIELARWAAHRWAAGRLRPLLASASPHTMVPALARTVARHGGASHRPIDSAVAAGVARLIGDARGGGVLRVSPGDDLVAGVLAAAHHGPVLVVHPSAMAVRVMGQRLRAMGVRVAVMPDEWRRAAEGSVEVVLGGRTAVWATMPSIASIVVLDEHDESLQEERTPTWHARDVAIERARRLGVPCVLISPCPTVTALHWAGRRWMRPADDAERGGWPDVQVVDRSADEPWKRSLVSTPLIEVIRDRSLRVVCVHNVTGRARLLACRACRAILRCEQCTAAVAQNDDGGLTCHRCGAERPAVCHACGSTALALVRPGVTRLRTELEKAAARPVVAVTGRDDVVPAGADVFIGTEAVLHRVGDADVVAFLDFDAELLAPRYRASEQAMSLLARAARVVNASALRGRVLVQTTLPDHDVVQAALLGDPGIVARAEAARRRELLLPPFGALARVSGDGAGPFVAAIPQHARDGDGFLVRAATWDALADLLADTAEPAGARLRIEVDPPRR